MHAKGFLHKILVPVIHKRRAEALSDVVLAAIHAKKLTLTNMGRSLDKSIQERSGIQKVNRLLGNRHLFLEKEQIAKQVILLLTRSILQPVMIIDWSKYPNCKDGMLRASLSASGRSITLYEEVHCFRKAGNRNIQRRFLETLKALLPTECKPILITDAGFHNTWFQDVLKLGWDYVGRVRGLKKCRFPNKNKFTSCKTLFGYATKEPRYLGDMTLTKRNPMLSHIYVVKNQLKKRKKTYRNGKVSQHKDSKAYSRSRREPWLLASSLHGQGAAKKVQNIYKQRMTIEEAFRDIKSSRYGLSLEEGRTKSRNRRCILLLIAMLAGLVAWLMGAAAEKIKIHYQFQSNSIKHRRVVSLFYLGCQIVRKKYHISFAIIRGIIASLGEATDA